MIIFAIIATILVLAVYSVLRRHMVHVRNVSVSRHQWNTVVSTHNGFFSSRRRAILLLAVTFDYVSHL